MNEKLQKLRDLFNQKKGSMLEKKRQLDSASIRAAEWLAKYLISEQAQIIIQQVAKKTQDELRYRIEEPVSLAMSAVFDDPLSLKMEFPIRRGRTECDMKWVNKEGYELDDLDYGDGGGALNVGELGCQIAVLTLMKNKARMILFRDEPLRDLKGGDLPERGALMISEIANELGIQVIMVSHIPEQKSGANRLITVTQKKQQIENDFWNVSEVKWEDQI